MQRQSGAIVALVMLKACNMFAQSLHKIAQANMPYHLCQSTFLHLGMQAVKLYSNPVLTSNNESGCFADRGSLN